MKGRREPRASSSRRLPRCAASNHRGAAGAEADTGDGAGILVQMPDALLPGRRRLRAAAGGRVRDRHRVPRRADAVAADQRDAVAKVLVDEGFAVLGWRARPGRRGRCPVRRRARAMPAFGQVFVAKNGLAATSSNGTSTSRASASSTRPTRTSRRCRAAVVVYKGMLTPDQLGEFYPDLRDERVRERARARALALQHEHVPELAARAPVPDARPQRRDQHRAGQRELDARPRRRDGERRAARRPRARVPDLHAGRVRHRALRRGARAAQPRRPAAAPRDPR